MSACTYVVVKESGGICAHPETAHFPDIGLVGGCLSCLIEIFNGYMKAPRNVSMHPYTTEELPGG